MSVFDYRQPGAALASQTSMSGRQLEGGVPRLSTPRARARTQGSAQGCRIQWLQYPGPSGPAPAAPVPDSMLLTTSFNPWKSAVRQLQLWDLRNGLAEPLVTQDLT